MGFDWKRLNIASIYFSTCVTSTVMDAPLYFDSNELSIFFHSDGGLEGQGFKVMFETYEIDYSGMSILFNFWIFKIKVTFQILKSKNASQIYGHFGFAFLKGPLNY